MKLVRARLGCVALVVLAAVAGCAKSPTPENLDTATGGGPAPERGGDPASSIAELAIQPSAQTPGAGSSELRGPLGTSEQADGDGPANRGGQTDSADSTACSDGKDNDGDGLVDWQHDLGCYSPGDNTEGGFKTRELDHGWSVFEPSKDTRIIYVSSSVGKDAHAGTSPAKPKKTLAAALAATRKRRPDWILLARGDTWTESLQVKEGRSRSEPFVVATYGESTKRPLLQTGSEAGLLSPGLHYNNFAVVGLAFYAHTRDPKSPAYEGAAGSNGFDFFSEVGATGQGILLEDCLFNFYVMNVIQGDGVNKDIALRRNIFTNNYSDTSHSHGLFSWNASVLLEENVFDHNGWRRQQTGEGEPADGQATMFNHNTYFGNQRGTTFRRNIFLRASSIGNKWIAEDAPGSAVDIVIDDNLYVDGEVGISIGGNDPVAPYRFKNVTISNNVFFDIGRSRPTNRTLGWYLDIDDWDGGKVSKNLFLHQPSTAVDNVYAIGVLGVTRNVVIEDNVIHGLYTQGGLILLSDGTTKQKVSFINNTVQSQIHEAVLIKAPSPPANYTFAGNTYYSGRATNQWFDLGGSGGDLSAWKKASGATGVAKKVTFPDPTRSIETYQRSLGKTGTIEAFVAAVLEQSKYNWRPEYTAAAVNEWVLAGFIP